MGGVDMLVYSEIIHTTYILKQCDQLMHIFYLKTKLGFLNYLEHFRLKDHQIPEKTLQIDPIVRVNTFFMEMEKRIS